MNFLETVINRIAQLWERLAIDKNLIEDIARKYITQCEEIASPSVLAGMVMRHPVSSLAMWGFGAHRGTDPVMQPLPCSQLPYVGLPST